MPDFHYHNVDQNRTRRLPVVEFSGLSIPDKDHISARGPHQDGATYLDTFYRPREFTLQYWLRGCDPAEFELRHRELAQVLDPKQEGELRIYDADGRLYTLACRLATALEVNRHGPRIAEVLAQFVADDPFFRGPIFTQAFSTAGVAGLTIPFTIPATISGGGGVAAFNITNEGQAETYPTIVVTTPAWSPAFINDTTGAVLIINTPVTAGQIEVDMQNRRVDQVVGGIPTSLLGHVVGDFWTLASGVNALRITTNDPAVVTGTITWAARYLAVV